MPNYELMVIYEQNLKEAEVKKEISSLKDLIKKLEGKIEKEDFWGLKNTAYPIKKESQAYYFVINFEVDSEQTGKITKHLSRRGSGVVRNLLTKV